MDAQLRAQLRQTIYVAHPSGASAYGDQAYGEPVNMSARVEADDREIADFTTGELLRTDTLIITEDAITLDSRIWLPGEDKTDESKARRPARVITAIDERGNVDHYETLLGGLR